MYSLSLSLSISLSLHSKRKWRPLDLARSSKTSAQENLMDSEVRPSLSLYLHIFRKRPYPDNELSNFTRIGAVTTEHSGVFSPPMSLSFCKLIFYSTSTYWFISNLAEKSRVCQWVAHQNAIFDICWIKVSPHFRLVQFCKRVYILNNLLMFVEYYDIQSTLVHFWIASIQEVAFAITRILDIVNYSISHVSDCFLAEDTRIITASGDQSVKVWDAQEKKCIATLMGHTGSVKSTCSHPTNPGKLTIPFFYLIVSGARDGLFMLWDLRCSNSKYGRPSPIPLVEVRDAHKSPHGRRVRSGKAAPTSVTSVLYLKDEISIASAGAVDSVVKFWDVRNLKVPVIQACPNSEVAIEKKRRLHGISSLSQDLNGVFIAASCMDNRIYLYNVLQLEKGPVKSFSGCFIESFFIKSALSPDASHILGGSSDGNAYIWQVNKPQADPITMKGHNGEVTAVDWCQSEVGKIATSSDDFTVCFWNVKNSCYSNTRSPSSIRRRVMAPPSMECRKLFMDEEPVEHQKGSNSTNSITMPQLGTPKCQKKNFSSELYSKETLEKTPEALLNSPSSVLNPPSSLKRKTIRDYFIAPS
ncbi:hypothetical protein RHGRI_028199 [Rhododendron griersonianum]|uniref:Uncharacterized protein n=1 Tax=Rhododendron griersonianum TaxID=479676 RepID=A0AAV6IH04_9ERIC|nr:hypothetical protein RHGRI_028199 [Rhododendron griersonianum]